MSYRQLFEVCGSAISYYIKSCAEKLAARAAGFQ
jgi:hypothetical protein